MKKLLISLIALFNLSWSSYEAPDLVIDVFDSDFSMAYTLHYQVKGDSIVVRRLSGISGEIPRILYKKEITETDRGSLLAQITSPDFEKLKSQYTNYAIRDVI